MTVAWRILRFTGLARIRWLQSSDTVASRAGRFGRFVVQYSPGVDLVFDQPPPPGSSIPDERSLYLGDDEHGTALEVVAIALDAERLLVVHAMKLRAAYREQYREALPYRKLQ